MDFEIPCFDVSAACSNVVIMAGGQQVWQGTPEDLNAAGTTSDAGDSPSERGYSAILDRRPEATTPGGGWK